MPPVVVLAGRRVPLANFIPYWRQFTTPETVARREASVLSFFRAPDAERALDVARELGARFVFFAGAPIERARSRRARRAGRAPCASCSRTLAHSCRCTSSRERRVYRFATAPPVAGCR